MRIDKNNITDAETRIRNFIKENNREPNTVRLRDMDTNKDVNIPIRQVNGLFFNIYTFWLKQGRYPNYATLNIEKSEPTIQNFQDNAYNCCPTSLSMASTKLFKPVTEAEAARVLGTTRNGTSPANLIANAPKLGFRVVAMNRAPANVAAALGEYKAVLCHYQTGPADCSGFINDYGHYCLIKSVSSGKYTILDPTKGQYQCSTGVMDQATNGRDLKYYAVSVI
ncbi:hypothetical protein FGU46_03355 [Methanobacterium sp. CWC-01]|uniref:cysteine peptidase family C39 domain-containing protein n=1 Tax=Methanobacterium aridiramus TaxID=2584467 RepID=UPI0025766021|nr:cysteine peptidase family C39 domain-containing protein [Methanobacterium sp. CWC-01]WJI09197.1 hypothetical protein FGU46_03355 [Methanobacterium sp. CWC-01]